MKRLFIWFRYRGFLFFVFFNLISLLALFIIKKYIKSDTFPVVLLNLFNYMMIICLFMLSFHNRLTRFKFFHGITAAAPVKYCLTGVFSYFIGMFCVMVSLTVLQYFFHNLPQWFTASNDGFTLFLESPNIVIRILWILIIVAVGPFVEELLFRGFLQNAFSHTIRYEFLTILLTSLIFALFHYNSFANIIFAFVVGLTLSVIKSRTNNLILTTIVHGTVNAVSLTVGIIILQYVQ